MATVNNPPISTSGQHSTPLSWIQEKVKSYGKVGAVAIPVLAVAAAAYTAPVTIFLATLGVFVISTAAVRTALSGEFGDAETVKKVIVVALLVTGITLAGVAVGWTPIFAHLFITAMGASSFGSSVAYIACGAFLLSSLWGYAGGFARSALENAFSVSSEKIGNYFRDVQNGAVPTPGKFWDAFCMFSYLAFKQDLHSLLSKMPDAVEQLNLHLATDEELLNMNRQNLQTIGQCIVLNNYMGGTLVSQIPALLNASAKLVDRCSNNGKKQMVLEVLDKLPSISEFRRCHPAIENFLTLNKHVVQSLREDFKLKVQPTLERISKESEQLASAEGDPKEKAKGIFNLQTELRDLKQMHARLTIAFQNDKELKSHGEMIVAVMKKLDAFAIKLSNREKADIDLEDAVWNALITNAQTPEKIDNLLMRLKNILGVSSNDEIDAKMTALGLGTVKALLDKGIVTRDEFLNNYALVESKVLDYLTRIQQSDFRSKVYEVLSAAAATRPDIGTVQRIASECFYRLAMAFSVLTPILIAPVTALVGAGVGLVGLGIYGLINRKIVRLEDARTMLAIKSDGDARTALFNFLVSSTMRRTLFGVDEDSQRDLRTFINADIFGKLRLLSWEFGFATLMGYISVVARTPFTEMAMRSQNGALGWLGLNMVPSLQGAMLTREMTEAGMHFIHRLTARSGS